MKTPCHNCEDRHVGCHSKCRDYKEFRLEREKIYEIRKRDGEINNFVDEVKSRVRNKK